MKARSAAVEPVLRWLWWSPARLGILATGSMLGLFLVAHLVFAAGDQPALSAGRGTVCPAPSPTNPGEIRAEEDPVPGSPGCTWSVVPSAPGVPAASSAPASSASASSVPAAAAPAPAAVPSTGAAPPIARTGPAASAETASATVLRWAGLWARPAVPKARWLADLAPLTAAEYIPLLRSVDPANVPATRVTGPVRWQDFRPGYGGTAVVAVDTASGRIHLSVINTAYGWRCQQVVPG